MLLIKGYCRTAKFCFTYMKNIQNVVSRGEVQGRNNVDWLWAQVSGETFMISRSLVLMSRKVPMFHIKLGLVLRF